MSHSRAVSLDVGYPSTPVAQSGGPEPASWRRALPVLEGRITTAREVQPSDARSLFELFMDPEVNRYLSPPPPSLEALTGFVTWAQKQREKGAMVCFAIVPAGLRDAVGIIQMRAFDPSFALAEWGFVLGSAFWSTGVFEDAASHVLEFAFDTLHVHRLEARAVSTNVRGNGALQKLGAVTEAVLAQGLARDGQLHEQLLWAMLADDWRAQDAALRGQFDLTKAKTRVQEAITRVRPHIGEAFTPDAAARPYPFYLTSGASEE
jgi:RimJ/RimL family protein N-acetyltransferase